MLKLLQLLQTHETRLHFEADQILVTWLLIVVVVEPEDFLGFQQMLVVQLVAKDELLVDALH